ncbi:unnamed protein product [Peronospora belbahrii]|uniref:FYVE-type domain-containing protein n=1 Tax=Peronospora belbahrii TaxID=622444 RepID=A0ABN8D049_9STRA|nr:unnamed protein product [Peronospora belbahrii]
MKDPFFGEDDGEFDDLYGNLPSSASFPTVRQKPRNNEMIEGKPITPSGMIFERNSMTSSSVVSGSCVHDRLGSTINNTTEFAAFGKQEKRRNNRGKPVHKRSQEIFDVQWESDVKVVKCGLCKSDFSLVRRRHHCRHCGRIMCSDCSSFLYFELSRRKHRVCSTCKLHLLTEQEAYDRETTRAGDPPTNLFVDSSNVGPPASSSLGLPASPTRTKDNLKARKKQADISRKEQKCKEKLRTQRGVATGPITPTTTRNQSFCDVNQSTVNDAAIFDSEDDGWFTDVPDQQTHSRNSVEVYSEDADLKEPGWRDRIKDTYTITPAIKQTLAFTPTTDNLPAVGFTPSDDISDQFQYDVSKSGCVYDDEISADMPRPKQQTATLTNIDRGVRANGLSGNGYFSDQFQYNDVDGPGLGHDDDHSVGMPRPKQQLTTTRYSYNSTRHKQNQLDFNFTDKNTAHEQGLQARSTLTDFFSATKRWESTAKMEKNEASTNSHIQENQNLTLNGVNSLYSPQNGPRMPAPTVTSLSPGRLTFYGQDADELVVDDSPGYFEATMEKREAHHKKEEEHNEQLARDMAWANSSPQPTVIRPNRSSSDQDSYSIVDLPSHTSDSSIRHQRGDVNGTSTNEKKAKSGFTGVLKRFFKMGSKKSSELPQSSATARQPEKDIADNYTAPVSGASHRDRAITTDSVSGGLLRHTVVKYDGNNREELVRQENSRYTMAPHVDLNPGMGTLLPSQVGGVKQHEKQELDRKHRGTFDELFMSPKDTLAIDDFLVGESGWGARVEVNANVGRERLGATGVARFDQKRPINEAGEFVLGYEPQLIILSSQSATDFTEAWRESAVLSLLNDKQAATQPEESVLTWSNIRPASGLGTATYAVPTSLQSRAVNGDIIGTSTQNETLATLGSIINGLKYGSASKKLQGQESIDDFFAEFEENNDYVFDAVTGGYVAARIPPPTSMKQLESIELLVPAKVTSRMSDHSYSDPSPVVGTAVATNYGEGEEVDDEVAEIIVGKISSLESELAALKQLIRTRKGCGRNKLSKPRVTRSTANSSVRKENIFDSDSSDGDMGKNGVYASSIRLVVDGESKERPGSKKRLTKPRKDSFADLFEDSPNEQKMFGSATSYEALFQIEPKLTDINKESVSDNDADPLPLIKSRTAKLRRSSWETSNFELFNDPKSEPQLASLKERLGKQLSWWKTRDDLDDTSTSMNDTATSMNEGQLFASLSRLEAKQGSTDKQDVRDDPIDVLFDMSNDRDVAELHGRHGGHDVGGKFTLTLDKNILSSQKSSSEAEANGSPAVIIANMESVAPMSESSASDFYSFDLQGLNAVNNEEKLSINWSKMRKIKRHKPKTPPFSNAGGESSNFDSRAKGILLEPSLFSEDWHPKADHTSPEHAVPTAFPGDASSRWMSVDTMENETVHLSLKAEDVEYQCVHESKHMIESASEAVVTNEKKRGIEPDVFPGHASMNSAPVENAVPSLTANEEVMTGEASGSVEQLPLAASSFVEESTDTNRKTVGKDDATFKTFDKSKDMGLLSTSSQMGQIAQSGKGRENVDKKSLAGNHEAFTFEVQAPKKRSSVDALTTICSVESVSVYSESSPSSQMLSAVDKYTTFAEELSSRTPSIDGSRNDPADTMADDDSMLGTAEVQAFDTDWQQMQVEEKERKKRLQVKQRQARRDKQIRKQGAFTKLVSTTATTHGLSKNKSKRGKKKKKDNEKNDAALSILPHKKSGSSRKYRQDATDNATSTLSEPPRSLTEL